MDKFWGILWEYKIDVIGFMSTSMGMIAAAKLLPDPAAAWMLLTSGILSQLGAAIHRGVENRKKEKANQASEQV